MRIPGLKKAKAFSRWVQARLLGGAIILGYHSIADVTREGYDVCVSPQHFAEHMEVISKYAHPIRLSKLVEDLDKGTLQTRSIAVTFDDGYADNLYQAKPILEKYHIPATVFVCTGYAGKEFWWDELERLIMTSKGDLGTLYIRMGKISFDFPQPAITPKDGGAIDNWARTQVSQALYHFLLTRDVEEREHLMNAIRSWACLAQHEPEIHRAMDHAELLQLGDGGLVELGSHTRNHPMLPDLPFDRQRQEILLGKQDLEQLLSRPVVGFAYPNGRATKDAKSIVQAAGFDYACSSLHNKVRPGCDVYELTRLWQQDVDGDKFMSRLQLWGVI